MRLGIVKVQSGRIHVSNISGKANQVPFVLFSPYVSLLYRGGVQDRQTQLAWRGSKISKFAYE